MKEFFRPTRAKVILAVIIFFLYHAYRAILSFLGLELSEYRLPCTVNDNYVTNDITIAWMRVRSCPNSNYPYPLGKAVQAIYIIWSYGGFIAFYYLIACILIFLYQKIRGTKIKEKANA